MDIVPTVPTDGGLYHAFMCVVCHSIHTELRYCVQCFAGACEACYEQLQHQDRLNPATMRPHCPTCRSVLRFESIKNGTFADRFRLCLLDQFTNECAACHKTVKLADRLHHPRLCDERVVCPLSTCQQYVPRPQLRAHLASMHPHLYVLDRLHQEFVMVDLTSVESKVHDDTVVVALLARPVGAWICIDAAVNGPDTRYWMRWAPAMDIETVQFLTGDVGEELTRCKISHTTLFQLGSWAGRYPAFTCRIQLASS